MKMKIFGLTVSDTHTDHSFKEKGKQMQPLILSLKQFLHLTSRLLARVSLLPVLNMDAPVSCSFLVASDLFLLENRKS